jgi:hypothetical protein
MLQIVRKLPELEIRLAVAGKQIRCSSVRSSDNGIDENRWQWSRSRSCSTCPGVSTSGYHRWVSVFAIWARIAGKNHLHPQTIRVNSWRGVPFVVTFWLAPKAYPKSEPRSLSIIHVKIELGLGCLIDQGLEDLFRSFPNQFPAQNAACGTVDNGHQVDPVFLLPIKVNNSSISVVLTSAGMSVSGKLSACALTQSEKFRWWKPSRRAMRRKFMPST